MIGLRLQQLDPKGIVVENDPVLVSHLEMIISVNERHLFKATHASHLICFWNHSRHGVRVIVNEKKVSSFGRYWPHRQTFAMDGWEKQD
jgi:hypothetical protein